MIDQVLSKNETILSSSLTYFYWELSILNGCIRIRLLQYLIFVLVVNA